MIKGILGNPKFDGHIDYSAYQEFEDSQHQYCDMMSGNWAWRQSVCHIPNPCIPTINSRQDIISTDPSTHGTMFVPIILGSDKTTVPVTTGQNKYYPLYLSIGNVRNHMRRAHKNALVVIAFLPIPKGKNQPLFVMSRTLILQQVLENTRTQKSSGSSNKRCSMRQLQISSFLSNLS